MKTKQKTFSFTVIRKYSQQLIINADKQGAKEGSNHYGKYVVLPLLSLAMLLKQKFYYHFYNQLER